MIKYIEFGAFAVVNVIIGSLLIALATDNYGGDTSVKCSYLRWASRSFSLVSV